MDPTVVSSSGTEAAEDRLGRRLVVAAAGWFPEAALSLLKNARLSIFPRDALLVAELLLLCWSGQSVLELDVAVRSSSPRATKPLD